MPDILDQKFATENGCSGAECFTFRQRLGSVRKRKENAFLYKARKGRKERLGNMEIGIWWLFLFHCYDASQTLRKARFLGVFGKRKKMRDCVAKFDPTNQ